MRDRLRRSIAEPGADETAHREHLPIVAHPHQSRPHPARTRMAAHLFTVEDYLLEHRTPSPTTS
ncbi:hypothetical protein AB0F43_21150 [Kribbella sp. NPDC023972]|uniref:hypothetical protein n=1 Tax=Kribbella sp. NPDC023972 TaxID=3154795 RepID=UPI0033E107BF